MENNYFPLRTEDKKIVQKNSDLQKLFTYNTDAGKPYQMTRAEWAMPAYPVITHTHYM